jgi:murein DD-endopeptidase MepM/ murein hydrolase activator NlpD
MKPSRTHVRALAAAAFAGFLAGAFTMAYVVWNFGNVVGSHEARSRMPPSVPAVVDRWIGAAVERPAVEPGDALAPVEPATGTAGTIPRIGPAPSEAPELESGLLIPVRGVRPDQLRGSFHDARNGRRHEAIDILAPRNSPVLAVAAGTIAKLFESRAGGLTIYQFDETERFTFYYAHLERYAEGLREGQPVEAGQIIAYVGTSGNAPQNTPHLHFAIFRLGGEKRWWEGTAVDPYGLLKGLGD